MVLIYPTIHPVLFSVGPVKVHWYALMYLIGFFSAWYLARYRVKQRGLPWSADQITDLIFYASLGVILGGRIGYMLFYNLEEWLHEPWKVFAIWQGGMSFHGGFLGVLVALYFFRRKYRIAFFELTDFMAPLVPIGLAAGRIGNFINGELWGRPTHIENWGMVYPYIDLQLRHPSQLYECLLEGIVLFILLWVYTKKPKPVGAASGLFLLSYGTFRFILEFFREPDAHLGFIWGTLTMGQLLSLPMILVGVFLLITAYRRERNADLS